MTLGIACRLITARVGYYLVTGIYLHLHHIPRYGRYPTALVGLYCWLRDLRTWFLYDPMPFAAITVTLTVATTA